MKNELQTATITNKEKKQWATATNQQLIIEGHGHIKNS